MGSPRPSLKRCGCRFASQSNNDYIHNGFLHGPNGERSGEAFKSAVDVVGSHNDENRWPFERGVQLQRSRPLNLLLFLSEPV